MPPAQCLSRPTTRQTTCWQPHIMGNRHLSKCTVASRTHAATQILYMTHCGAWNGRIIWFRCPKVNRFILQHTALAEKRSKDNVASAALRDRRTRSCPIASSVSVGILSRRLSLACYAKSHIQHMFGPWCQLKLESFPQRETDKQFNASTPYMRQGPSLEQLSCYMRLLTVSYCTILSLLVSWLPMQSTAQPACVTMCKVLQVSCNVLLQTS